MRILICFVTVVMLVTCSTPPRYLDINWKPGVIAILPFTNDSADVSVEKFARQLMYNSLADRKYELVDLKSVDSSLDSLGVTEAGQLSAVTDVELKQEIHADCLLFGHVIQAKRVMLGIYFEKTFDAEFKIIDTGSLETVFEDQSRDGESKIVLNPADIIGTAAKEFAKEITGDAIRSLLASHPLYTQMANVINRTVNKIPRKPEKRNE